MNFGRLLQTVLCAGCFEFETDIGGGEREQRGAGGKRQYLNRRRSSARAASPLFEAVKLPLIVLWEILP